jgi:N-methylhydantoinase A
MAGSNHIGIDTGGTFTDFIWADEGGRLRIHKQLSTPDDPAQAILTGLRSGAPPAGGIIHGSTVATNALLEGRGARTALITTAGFADVLAIGRQNRPDLYALVPQKPAPLVPRRWRFEARERLSARGEVLVGLAESEVLAIIDHLTSEAIESVAISLLFSFLNPAHEKRIADLIRRHEKTQTLHLSLSADILPEYREFERTATTVINAYVAPLMSRYLSRLVEALSPRRLAIMQSNGGVVGARMAGEQAVRTVLSGPAGGVVGARFVAGRAGRHDDGFPEIITFDMGGTSTDVALCPSQTPTTTDGEIAGLPLRIPVIDIHTVGAGGGSLANVDAGKALHVGPQSAGANPGPACYRADYHQWRDEMARHFPAGLATVSDANLVLGRLDPAHFLGGQMKLSPIPAKQALHALAERIGADSAEQAAWDVIRVANANMERAIRRISVERGHDPRRFTLVAFGGGGPLHACELAGQLQIPRVLIPPVPGVLSALGMLVAAPTRDYSQTVMLASDEPQLEEILVEQYATLLERAKAEMVADGYDGVSLSFFYNADMRYVGQSHELTIGY